MCVCWNSGQWVRLKKIKITQVRCYLDELLEVVSMKSSGIQCAGVFHEACQCCLAMYVAIETRVVRIRAVFLELECMEDGIAPFKFCALVNLLVKSMTV